MSTAALAKAQLIAKEVGVDLTVCFNPKELAVEKHASWSATSAIQDEPPELYGSTSPATLAVTLFFDTYEEKASVYSRYIYHMEKLIHVISDRVHRPPFCRFVWGGFCFPGVVETLSQKYTMFLSNGVLVRCECACKMTKVRSVLSRSKAGPREPEDRVKTFSWLWVDSDE